MKARAILSIIGLLLVSLGAGCIYWPAGIIILGAGLYADSIMGNK